MDSKLFVLLMLVLVQIKAQTYIVIVPNQVRPFTDLKISVQYLKPVSMETVTAELLDRNDGKIIMSNAVGHATEETPTILLPLPIPSIPQNIYRPCVRVIGNGSFPFSHQACMYVTRQATSIMVQTDKAIYKPGDTVKYTIFAIDGSLDMVRVHFTLAIYDPKGNKLDERNELYSNPIVEGEFVLSDMTTLGSWRIVAEPVGIVFRTTAKQETVVSNGQQINNKRKQCDRMKSRDMRRAEKCYRKMLQMMRKFVLVDTTAKIVKTQDKMTLQMSAKTQYFRVDEYVLPKFEVIMTLPKYSLTTDESLTVTVQARYTFDQAVKGYVVLTLSRGYSYYRYHYYSLRLFDLKAVERKKEIDGEVTFNIPVKLLSRLTRSFQHSSVSIVASVTDSVSGETLSQSGSVTFYKNPYQISFHPSMPANFKPGFPFPVMVKVSYPDGTPVTRGQVKVTETYFRVTALNDTVPDEIKFKGYSAESPFAEGQTVMIKTKTFKLRNDGIVFIKDLKIPKAVTTGNIKAQFEDVRVYKDLSRFQSPNNYLLKVEQVDLGQREVKDRAVFILKSNVQPVTGRYLVVSKNNIVAQGAFEISDPDYMATSIVILMTRDMAPSAHLVAYYVLNGVIVADGLKLSVENIYENKVSVEFDQSKTVQPKTSVKVKVTADVSSTVSVLVVDKSVRLLQKGNEITQDRVENELRKYGNFPIFYYPGWRYYPWSFPADDSYAIFHEAKLTTFTDAFLYNFDLHSLAKSVLPEVPIGYVPDSPSFARQEDMVLEAAPCEGPGCADPTKPSGQVRTEFPEAWICASQIVGDSGVAEFTAQAPDTITTWVASAFALHKDSGLGVAPIFANLTTFLPFFVVLQLPYSAVQNEVVVLEASVFNYYQESLNVLVTFRNDGWYEGIMFDEDGNEMPINATDDLQKCVLVEPNSPTPVFFVFKPLKSGLMPINVRIEEFKRNIFDEVLKHLLVKAEGEEISENHAILISHNTTITTNRSTMIKYPTHVVPGSEKIRVSVFGDIFGLTLKHLDRLIQMPYGCGEQNMVRFAPAVYATSYLGATDRYHYNKGLQDWIKKVLMTGIQRELLYRRNDNSFSAFGNADREGSLWLTTFVAKCFTQAAKLRVVPVDKQVIEKAAEYIVNQQDPTGFFRDRGHVHHKAMQGGTIGSRGSLTAYVLSTFREMMDGYEFQDESIFNTVSSAMKLAISYLNEIVEDDPIPDFEAAIGAYVNPANMAFLQALENSENKSTDGGLHWKSRSRALEIEIASYAMLAYIQQNDILTAVEILEWQVKQRNSFGGYRSTQDTVVALQALSEIAKLIYQKETMMDVSVFTTRNSIESPTAEFELNQLNQDVLQFNDFDGPVDTVEVGVEGKGLAMIDVSSFYNVFVEPQPPSYILTVEPYDDSPEQFKLKACTRFIIPDAQSNMAIMSVGVPSGFEASMVGISAILNGTEYVKRVERSGDRISIYFDEIPSSTICIHIKVVRKFNIAGLKRANVLVYSYYETDERAMVDYMPDALNDIKVCDAGGICGISNQELPLEQCNASPTSPP